MPISLMFPGRFCLPPRQTGGSITAAIFDSGKESRDSVEKVFDKTRSSSIISCMAKLALSALSRRGSRPPCDEEGGCLHAGGAGCLTQAV